MTESNSEVALLNITTEERLGLESAFELRDNKITRLKNEAEALKKILTGDKVLKFDGSNFVIGNLAIAYETDPMVIPLAEGETIGECIEDYRRQHEGK